MFKRCSIWLSIVSICILIVPQNRNCFGEDSFENEIKSVADAMIKFLKSENLKKIAIRKFEGPSSFPASAGPGIAEILVTQFKMNGFEIVGLSSKADVAVTGKYRLFPTNGGPIRPKLVELIVSFTLEDAYGNPYGGFAEQGKIEIRSKEADSIAVGMGITARLDTESGSEAKRREKDHSILLDEYNEPKAHIQGGNEIRLPESPYGMQVLVGGKATAITDQDGFAFCKLSRGDEFEVLLRNDSDYEAAVLLRLDGINTFHFSEIRSPSDESKPLYLHYIIPKKAKALVRGWHINNSAVKKYRITGYEGSAAMAANQDAEVGTISASFSAAWENGTRIPDGELIERSVGKNGDFIGFGGIEKNNVKAVAREIGQVREVLVVRYRK